MGFHINVYNMPRISDYKHAKDIFESRTAVRGENQSVRRLGDRYEKEKWLRQEIQDGIEVYVAGYYDTDLVRFYPTHKEITLGAYPSRSTQYFLSYIGGVYIYEFDHKKYVPAPFTRSPLVKNNQIECIVGLDRNDYHINARDWYAITYDNKPMYPEQFEKPVKYRFDARQMRELRLPYKKFLKYADTMLKLSNNEGVEHDEALSKQVNELTQFKGIEGMLNLFADEDKTYLSYYYALRQCSRSIWLGASATGNSRYSYRCNIGMIKRWLDKNIKLENPQVLVEVQPATSV
jgi:hypothetical protein